MNWVSDSLAKTIKNVHGERGEVWLENLPEHLKRCEARFGVILERPYEKLSYNLVVSARTLDGHGVVLKLPVSFDDLHNEVTALQMYAGVGAIKVLGVDEHLSAVMLEQVSPGVPLSIIEDDTNATEIFVSVCRKLFRKAPKDSHLPHVRDWATGLEKLRKNVDDGNSPFPSDLVTRAVCTYEALFESTTELMLLHGDLHHDNILLNGNDEWIAIDPKGVIGDPCFSAIQYMLNYTDRGGDRYEVLERRLSIISHGLDLDAHRIASWGLAQSVLSAWWNYDQHADGYAAPLHMAMLFAKWLDTHANQA